jgi:predicted small secreted protein
MLAVPGLDLAAIALPRVARPMLEPLRRSLHAPAATALASGAVGVVAGAAASPNRINRGRPDPVVIFCNGPNKGHALMRKNLSITLALLALIGMAPMLGACHTTAGAGEDISAGGHAITHTADKLDH